MSTVKTVKFYAGKSVDLPRFVYRRLAKALNDDPQQRAAPIAVAQAELLTGPHPDLRKFKFFLPEFLRRVLQPAEIAGLEAALAPRRAHAARLKMVYPNVSDEFSLHPEFLASVLDLSGGPPMARDGRFFTIGSCFARNISEFLGANGYNAGTFGMAEDLNSPSSNAFMFHLLSQPAQDRRELMLDWVRIIFPDASAGDAERLADSKLQGLADLAVRIGAADCVVLTLGNVVDFFRDEVADDRPLMEKVFPKFIAMPGSEDIEHRSQSAALLKKSGASLRLATTGETREAIALCIAGIRAATSAPIIVTLSPVPVDSVITLGGASARSAVEVDCVSKSRLRSAFDELVPELRSMHGAIHYFPSFEIVRWISPNLNIPTFGLEDAASRHVSAPILDAICSLFLDRFVRWTPQPSVAATAEAAR